MKARFAMASLAALVVVLQLPAAALQKAEEPPAPTARNGKRLLTALDVLKIQNVGSPAISPDGRKVAYTVSELRMDNDKPWTTVTHLWVASTAGGTPRQFTRGEKSAGNPAWSPDGKYLAFLTNRDKEEERQVWFIWPDGGEAWRITDHKGGISSFRFSPDGRRLLFTAADQPSKEEEQKKKIRDDPFSFDQDFRMSHIWTFDLESKEEKRLTEGDFTCSDPQWSPDGRRITFTTHPTPRADDGGLTDIWIMEVEGGGRRKLVENPGSDSSARWSPDGTWIAYVTNPQTNSGVSRSRLQLVPVMGGEPRPLGEGFELDAGTPIWSADGKTIFFSTLSRQDSAVFACELTSGAVRQVTHQPGAISLAEMAASGKTIVGTYSAPQRPAEIFKADVGFKTIERISAHNSRLDEFAMGAVEALKWTSKDGLEIEGVLTKPVGFEPGRRYPLLLNPHGGPTGASLESFNGTAQLMAANGYLVLQPNFRGSVGRGERFAAANKNSWGMGDYEDCMTGVDAVIAKGWADPDRMGAFGWSYGGYMTFWILTQTDRFKAVSPGAGLTNIYSMYSQNDIQRYLRWFYGDQPPWDNVDLYWDRSPMKYVKQVKTPTLILHGQNDTRVPIAQAQEFYRALSEMNVPVDFIVYPREGHGFREPRHNLDRMRRYLAFFGRYLDSPAVTEPADEMKALAPTGK